MTDIEQVSIAIQKWKQINVFGKPQKVTIPFGMYIRICNLSIWSTEKWANLLKHEEKLILFGVEINHFGYGVEKSIKVE